MDNRSLSHTRWKCQYHIVFIPKYRKKTLYGQIRKDVREIIATLCKYKNVEIIAGEVCVDHVYLSVAIPPKESISSFMRYLKGKSTLMVYDRHPELQSKWNKAFWASSKKPLLGLIANHQLNWWLLTANLVKDGNYGMPYLPKGLYVDQRRLSMFRDQLTEDRIRNINRLHREMKIYFPEYREALGKLDGAFSRANEIVRLVKESVGIKAGTEAGKAAVKWFSEQIAGLTGQLSDIEGQLHEKCHEIPHAENLLEISGIGDTILSGILAEMGNIPRFDNVKEIYSRPLPGF